MIAERVSGMAKKTMVKDYDQFQLRLPPGMRERIKEKADRADMSMNEAIVWCLEQYFPAPATLEQRVESLAQMVAALKRGNELESQIDEITDQIEKTLRDIADDRLSVTTGFAEKVSKFVEELDMEEMERLNDRPFDDDRYTTPAYPNEAFADPFELHRDDVDNSPDDKNA